MSDNVKKEHVTAPKDNRPLTFKLAAWYGYIFSGMFLLYGGINIVLSFLDHSYDDLGKPIAVLAIGLVLLIPVIAYTELKVWGYWSLVGVNALVVLLSIIGFSHIENLILLVLSGIALYTLLSANTKNYLFQQH
ncbi:MAG: hypothetical protein U9R56_02995 [candidate division Zixibacteria bacterium]|nr:hypothetical protein [candidate division Zixibacteria bacterium]